LRFSRGFLRFPPVSGVQIFHNLPAIIIGLVSRKVSAYLFPALGGLDSYSEHLSPTLLRNQLVNPGRLAAEKRRNRPLLIEGRKRVAKILKNAFCHSLLPDVWKQRHPQAVRQYRVEERLRCRGRV
jgi:hypothetical protein